MPLSAPASDSGATPAPTRADAPCRTRRAALALWLVRATLLGVAALLLAGIIDTLQAAPIPVAEARAQVFSALPLGRTLTVKERQRVFSRLARDMERNQVAAETMFPDHPWSQQDHRTRLMVRSVENVARTFKRDISEVYWLWDEGIRAGWVSPARRRPIVRVVPVQPRRR